MELRVHLVMCSHCSNFARQLKMLIEGASRLLKKKADVDEQTVRELERATLEALKKSSDS